MIDVKDDLSALRRYVSRIRKFPRLTRAEEVELVRGIESGRPESLHQLVEANLGFVVKVANEYRSLGLPFDDLLNEGNLGLIQAARRFDPDKNTKFITYAIWWIRKAILSALAQQRVVRVPAFQARRFGEINRTRDALRKSLGREPTREEISDSLSKSVETIDAALQRQQRETSLDAPVADDRTTSIGDLLRDIGSVSPEEEFIEQETLDALSKAVNRLTRRQRTIIDLRFGLAGDRAKTLQQVAERLGLSRERVRQIEHKAKERMRQELLAEVKGGRRRDRGRKSPRCSPRKPE